MNLVDIYTYAGGELLAYDLLSQRPLEHGISHKRMPSWDEHLAFMHQTPRPFRLWLVIYTQDVAHRDCPHVAVGAIEALQTNEFGVHILQHHQGRGYGKAAVRLFLNLHPPLPEIPAVRNGTWLANVAPANTRASQFFQKLGFKKIQETYA